MWSSCILYKDQRLFCTLFDKEEIEQFTECKLNFLQLSFIVQALRNPDVFCFADYPCHTVVTDILKAAPDDDNRDITTWYFFLNCRKALAKVHSTCNFTFHWMFYNYRIYLPISQTFETKFLIARKGSDLLMRSGLWIKFSA